MLHSSFCSYFMNVNGHIGHVMLFYLLFRSASKVPANEKKDRPQSIMSEASNYTGSSDCTTNANSPAGRVHFSHHVNMLHTCNHWKVSVVLPIIFIISSPQDLLRRSITLERDPTP